MQLSRHILLSAVLIAEQNNNQWRNRVQRDAACYDTRHIFLAKHAFLLTTLLDHYS